MTKNWRKWMITLALPVTFGALLGACDPQSFPGGSEEGVRNSTPRDCEFPKPGGYGVNIGLRGLQGGFAEYEDWTTNPRLDAGTVIFRRGMILDQEELLSLMNVEQDVTVSHLSNGEQKEYQFTLEGVIVAQQPLLQRPRTLHSDFPNCIVVDEVRLKVEDKVPFEGNVTPLR